MILYVGTRSKSSWSLRPYLALAEAGLAFETRDIALDRPDTAAQIAAVSPSGRVPVLHDGPVVVWDSLAICEYVAELAPALWPADRALRAQARAVSAEMHAGFAALRRDMPMDLDARHPGRGHTPEALADAARVQTIWREALAASRGPFLFGAFSIADAMFAPVTTRFTTYGVPLYATLQVYVDAVAALPGMARWRAGAARTPVSA